MIANFIIERLRILCLKKFQSEILNKFKRKKPQNTSKTYFYSKKKHKLNKTLIEEKAARMDFEMKRNNFCT